MATWFSVSIPANGETAPIQLAGTSILAFNIDKPNKVRSKSTLNQTDDPNIKSPRGFTEEVKYVIAFSEPIDKGITNMNQTLDKLKAALVAKGLDKSQFDNFFEIIPIE